MFSCRAANIWDFLYGTVAEKEAEFICDLWRQVSGSCPGNLLDIGCGTGRFFIPLAKREWSVTGIDSSEAMLSVLKQKLRKYKMSGEIVHSEFSSFQTDRLFDLAIGFFLIIYIRNDRDLLAFFKRTHEMMKPGGLLLINFFNAYEFWNKNGWHANMGRIFKAGHLKVRYASTPVDMLRGTADTEDLRLLDYNGKLSSDVSIRPVRYYSANSVRLSMKSAGFENVTFYSGFSDKKMGHDGTRATVITAAAIRP